MGPAMRALNERQRIFVYALLENGGNQTAAARAAGYSDTSPNVLRGHGHWLAHNDRVLAAIRELSERYMRSYGLMAAKVLVDIAADEKAHAKDRLRAAEALMNRIGLQAITEHHVKVQDDQRPREELVRELIELFRATGLRARDVLPAAAIEARPVNEGKQHDRSRDI